MNDGQNKDCCTCKQILPISAFGKHSKTYDKLQAACINCNRKSRKEWESDPYNRRNRKLRQKYGINCEIYDIMLLDQSNKCKICGSTDPKNKQYKCLVVDHCHKTGKVRGLLCDYCNVGLGRFMDSEELLLNAIKYLKESK